MRATEQKKPKNGVFLKIVAIAFAVYLLYSLISTQASINKKQNELDALRQEYTESLIRNEELQKTRDSYGTDEFIEEQAREKLGYAYPEEHFYVDVSGTD
ncbi:MAG: septum formation initiator family protein [Oscillospiraceae bacterium]|nr:septum formation initiator family protein [Oscillospiraceae bacterium]